MFPSRTSNPNSKARVTMVCGVLSVRISSARKVTEMLFAQALLPCTESGQQVWVLQS